MTDMRFLNEHAEGFFDLHWKEELSGQRPAWVTPFEAASPGPYPNHDSHGCYALFRGQELRYIGVGIGRGGNRYKGHGIGSRIRHVVAVDWTSKSADGSRIYRVRDKWFGITSISTIGFPPGYGYLAAALEIYLLTRPGAEFLQNKYRPGAD